MKNYAGEESDLLSLMAKVKRMYQSHHIVPRVASVDISTEVRTAFEKALNLIGDIDDLNTKENPVIVKGGVIDGTDQLSDYIWGYCGVPIVRDSFIWKLLGI